MYLVFFVDDDDDAVSNLENFYYITKRKNKTEKAHEYLITRVRKMNRERNDGIEVSKFSNCSIIMQK